MLSFSARQVARRITPIVSRQNSGKLVKFGIEGRAKILEATRLVLPEAGQPFEIVNPCTDFGFKKAFYNPVVLIDFLNHILDYQEAHQIVELSYMDKEFPSLDSLSRDFRVDIVCKTRNDRYFLVEMLIDYTADHADKAYVEFTRFLSRIHGEKVHDLSMGDRKRRRIGQTDVDAQDFWQKIEEVCTLVISNKRFNPEAKKEKYRDENCSHIQIYLYKYRICNLLGICKCEFVGI